MTIKTYPQRIREKNKNIRILKKENSDLFWRIRELDRSLDGMVFTLSKFTSSKEKIIHDGVVIADVDIVAKSLINRCEKEKRKNENKRTS